MNFYNSRKEVNVFEADEAKRQEIQRLEKKMEKQKFVFWIISMFYFTFMMLPAPILLRIWVDNNSAVAAIIDNGFFLVTFVLAWFGAWIVAVCKVGDIAIRDEARINQLKLDLGEIEEE